MSFSATKRARIKNYILEKIASHDDSFIKKTVDAYGISDKTVYRYLNEMVDEGILIKNKKQYSLSYDETEFCFKRTEAGELGEDVIYARSILKYVETLKPNVRSIWDYGFTEIMNNAIDHSCADNIKIIIRNNHLRTSITIIDDGVGIFENIKSCYKLPSINDAVNELFKGKGTTDTKRHSGEGIFFTSRLMDYFAAVSNGAVFTHNKYSEISEDLGSLPIGDLEHFDRGTCVYMSLSNLSRKNAADIFNKYASVEGGFTKTSIPLKNIYDMPPVARSQAKRLVKRLENFEEVILDFEGIESIGQGFAHELFVVFAREHLNTNLIPVNANPLVQKIISHVRNDTLN